jgi:hypothetical protein
MTHYKHKFHPKDSYIQSMTIRMNVKFCYIDLKIGSYLLDKTKLFPKCTFNVLESLIPSLM